MIWISQFPEAVRGTKGEVNLYFFPYLCSKMAVIVLNKDVGNCVCVSLRVSHHVYA